MAYKIGYANGYKELLTALRGFLCNAKMAHNIAANVANTGNGYVSAERASTSPVDETWTLTATNATTFSVTGSVSGAQADATVGTAYDNGIVAFKIVAGGTAFEADDEFTFDVADGLGATEVYTEKRYDNDYDGAGEYETILMGPGTAGDDEIYTAIQTVSSAGDDYYNWRLMGMTAYSDVGMQYMPGITQGRLPRMLMWNQQIKYWLAANGRHYRMVAKISSVYEAMYMGFPLPYGLPTQFPYPLVVGGAACPTTTASYNRYSSTQNDHRAFPNPYGNTAGTIVQGDFDADSYQSTLKVLLGTSWVRMLSKSGTTLGHTNCCWPYVSSYNASSYPQDLWTNTGSTNYGRLRENIDGSRPIVPVIPMIQSPVKHQVGELQGIGATPAFGGMAAEDPITDGLGNLYIAFPILPNADSTDFFAFKLE